MKKVLKLFVLSLLLTLSVQARQGHMAPILSYLLSNTCEEEENTKTDKTIRFIELNDLHAHLTPHLQEVRSDNGDITLSTRGGIARIATKIDELSNENTIVMNIGDTYHGGAEAMFSVGNDIVEIINQLPIDIAVPGNWDYAYGPVVTNARFSNLQHSQVKRPNFLHLAANIKFKDPIKADTQIKKNIIRNMLNYTPGDDFLAPTKIIEKDNIKIGIIGISSDIIQRMHPTLAMNLDILQGEQNYKDLINTLSTKLKQDGANMIVVMSELGIQKDKKLADIIIKDSVDIFFSAHTHETTYALISSVSGAKVVEAGNDTYLGQLDANFKDGKLISMDWTLHSITQDISPKTSILSLVENIREPYLKDNPNITAPQIMPENIPSSLASIFPSQMSQTLKYSLNKKLAVVPFPLTRKQALESSYNNAFSDILRAYTHTDVAMTSGFRFSPPLTDENPSDETWVLEDNLVVDSEISVEDAYRFIPLSSIMSQATISVSNFKTVIEENLNNVFSTDVFEQSGGWVDGYSGINLTLSLKNTSGQRISSLLFDGQVKNDNDIISITGCSRPFEQEEGVLCGYRGFSNIQAIINPQTNEAFLNNEFFIFALENGLLNNIVPRNDIEDISKTLMWPDSPFVQPLEGAK